jgi:hypothetical protein
MFCCLSGAKIIKIIFTIKNKLLSQNQKKRQLFSHLLGFFFGICFIQVYF